MLNQRSAHFEIATWTKCVAAPILLAFALSSTATASVQPANEITLTFVGEVKDVGGYQRLTGVAPSADSLRQVELHPGDIVQYEVVKQVVVIEHWSKEFTWEKRHKQGKDTIIEHQHQVSFAKVALQFGVSIAPKFKLGNVEIDASKGGKQTVQAQQPFKFAGAQSDIGSSGVQPGAPPAISRPPLAPANATAPKDPTLKTLAADEKTPLAHGAIIPGCTLKLKIIRASAH